ncbi:MAG TPA: hypothetical protein VHF27_07650 [Acidimicrobiales bacterium]|nr:hypothetical protein [Acidimicrobiales bacterium]
MNGGVCVGSEDENRDVKRATAVGHLVEMAATADDRLRLREGDIGWPLQELWAGGELLEEHDQLEAGGVVLVLDLPPDELPWLAVHPSAEWVGAELRLGKRPFFWAYRPALWPVWNHRHRRLVRFWTARNGTDAAVLDALRERRLAGLPVAEPSAAQLVDQLRVELAASEAHLRSVVSSYWDPTWRRLQKGPDTSAEDQLWRAAQATVEIKDALAELGR